MGKRMVSLFLAFILALSACSFSVFAEDAMNDGDYAYVLSGGGAALVACSSEKSVISLPEKLGDFKLVAICENAFSASVTDIFIPSTVTDIAQNAFQASVTIYAFADAYAKTYADNQSVAFCEIAATGSLQAYVGKTLQVTTSVNASFSAANDFVGVSGNSVQALKKGDGQIAATLDNGIVALLHVAIADAPKSITGVDKAITLYVGESKQLNPKISNGNYDNAFTYASSDKAVASVSAEGLIIASTPGIATIKIKYENGIFFNCTVTVGNPANTLNLNKDALLIGVGEPVSISYTTEKNEVTKSVTYSSSNKKIAYADASGKIISLAVGTATITATADSGATDSCIVSVAKAPSSVHLNLSEFSMGIGESVQVKPSVNSGAVCSTYYWKSKDTSIATVSNTGLITGKKVGTVKVYVYPYNHKTKTPEIKNYVLVSVKKAPSKIELNKKNLVLGLGESFDLNAKLPSGTASYNRKTAFDTPGIVSYAKGMIVTGKALGTTKFSITTFNGKKATCTITVKPAPKKIACKPTKVKLSLKQTYQLEPYVNSGSVCSSYIYKSSDKKVCTVSSTGLVKVKDYGACYIYIYTYNHTKENPIYCRVKINVGYITNKVASYTTYFDKYYWGKSVNLKMACKYINGKTDGYILQPGQVFSFNSAVGPRTSARGFVDAKVIVGGAYVDGIGGGICQAATTIFNATLLSNLKIVERHYHNLKSSYCPVGRDATVSWGSQDYKFKNNFKTPIRIKMNYSSNGSINCTVYSLAKVKVPKIKLPVVWTGKGYKLTRYAGKKANYVTYSYYSN